MILYVQWIDAVSYDPWIHKDQIKGVPHVIESVGHFISENKEVLTIALNHDIEENNYSCIMHIPQAMIRKKVKMK